MSPVRFARRCLLLLSILAAGCGNPPSSTPTAGGAVAQVNGTAITQQQLDLRLRSTLGVLSGAGAPTGNAQMLGRVRGSVVRGLIFDTVIAQEAARQHLAASEADVNSQLTQSASDAGGQSQLQSQLAAANQSMDSLRDEIRSRLNEQGLEDFFARDRVTTVLQALAQGSDFGQLVSEYSDSPDTKPKAGQLGTLGDDQIRALLGDSAIAALAALQPGDYTKAAARTKSGYEILRIDGAAAGGRALREILVAAPNPYTVRERPSWFSQQVFQAILDDCQRGHISVYVKDSGADPCAAGAPSTTPRPASPTR